MDFYALIYGNLLYVVSFFVFLLGASLGSFINVCIYRIPRGESIIFERSHCPKCGYKIEWYFNIPILSWFILRGRCVKCGGRISPIYPLVELLSGILSLALFFNTIYMFYPLHFFVYDMAIVTILLPIFFIDIRYWIIPDRLIIPGFILCEILIVIYPDIINAETSLIALISSIAGGVVMGGLLFLFNFVGKKLNRGRDIIGNGDIKLLAFIGAAFGIYSIAPYFILLFSCWIGIIYVFLSYILPILDKKKRYRRMIPFGPFIVVSTLIWLFLK